jgi:hypothetical protein
MEVFFSFLMCKEAKWKNKEKWQDLGIRKAWDFAFLTGLGPWTWDQVLHTVAHQIWRKIIFILLPGPDFYRTLSFLGTSPKSSSLAEGRR